MLNVRQEIAKNLLYYRKKNNYTQKQLAEMLGVKNSAVSNWENGQNSIDIETLCKACEIFNVTLNDMYGVCSEASEYSKHERAVITAYRSNPAMQGAVDKLLGISDNNDSVMLYTAAKSSSNRPPKITEMPRDKWDTIKTAPDTDEELI